MAVALELPGLHRISILLLLSPRPRLLLDRLQGDLFIGVLQPVPPLLLGRLQRTEHGPEDDAVEHDASEDQRSTPPSKLLDQYLSHWREDEGAQTTAANSDSRGQRAVLLKVRRHTDDRGQVDEAEAEPRANAHREDQREHVLGKGANDQTESGQNCAGDCDRPAAIFVDEGRGDGARAEGNPDEERDYQRGVSLALVKVREELLVEDAVGIGDAIG